MRSSMTPALASLALAALASLALASGPRHVRITLKDGKIVEGELVRRADELYRIQDGARVREVAEDDVVKVEFLETAPAPVAPVATFDAPVAPSLPECTSGFRETRAARLVSVRGGYAWKHASWVTALAFSHGGKRLLSGSRDGTIVVRDAGTGEALLTCVDRAGVNAVALSADETRALSGNAAGEVSLWDLETGQRVRVVGVHEGVPVLSVALSPDGKLALSCGAEATAMGKLWDTTTGRLVQTIELGAPGMEAREERDDDDERPPRRRACAMSLDGKRAAVGSPERVEVWDVDNLEFVCSLTDGARLAGADALAYVPGTHRFLTASDTVRQWYGSTAGGYGDPIETGKQDGHGRSLAISADGTCAAWDQVGGNPAVTVWDVKHETVVAKFPTPFPVLSLALSPDGKRLATGDRTGAIRIWDAASGKERGRVDGHLGPVLAVCQSLSFGIDGAFPVSGDAPRIPPPEVWRAHFAPTDPARLPPAALSPDGKLALLSTEPDHPELARLLHGTLDADTELADLSGGDATGSRSWAGVLTLTLGPGGRRLLAASNAEISVWNLETHERLREVPADFDLTAIAVNADASRAVGGDPTGVLRVFDLHSDAVIRTTPAHAARVTAIACSPDGKRVASGALDETIRLGDLETGKELDRIDLASSHDHATALAFSRDGRALLAGTGRGVVLRFELK